MADDALTLDYLGQQTPLTVSDRAALPVGAPFAGVGPVPTFGAKSAVGTAQAPSVTADSVTTTPSGAPGIPGDPSARASATGGGGLDLLSLFGSTEKFATFLKNLFGRDFAADELASIAGTTPLPTDDQGRTILGNAEQGFNLLPRLQAAPGFQLPVDAQGRGILGDASRGFNLLTGPSALPELPDLLTGGVTDVPSFGAGSFSGGEAAAYGAQLPESGFDLGGAASLAVPLAQLGFSLLQGDDRNGIGGALVKAAIGLMRSLPELVTGAANPFLTAMNAPQLVGGIVEMLDPGPDTNPETLKRRAARTSDAVDLQREILGPLASVRTADDLVTALKTRVGGSTVGDALTAILNNNLGGGWSPGAGNSFDWRPDPELAPLRTFLNDLGFTGATQPTRGDVGGVGEIVLGAGSPLDPYAGWASRTQGLDQGAVAALELSDPNSPLRRLGILDERGNALESLPKNAFTFGPEGWDSILRALETAITGARGESVPSPWAVSPTGVSGTIDASPVDLARYGVTSLDQLPPEIQQQVAQRNQYAAYLDAVQSMDPEAARVMLQSEQGRAQDLATLFDVAGGGS